MQINAKQNKKPRWRIRILLFIPSCSNPVCVLCSSRSSCSPSAGMWSSSCLSSPRQCRPGPPSTRPRRAAERRGESEGRALHTSDTSKSMPALMEGVQCRATITRRFINAIVLKRTMISLRYRGMVTTDAVHGHVPHIGGIPLHRSVKEIEEKSVPGARLHFLRQQLGV